MKTFIQFSLAFIGLFLVALLLTKIQHKGVKPMTEQFQMTEACIDGVTYIYFREAAAGKGYGYLSVKFGEDSKVITCK